LTQELTLVLLAAGMGSRYGGLKQLDPFGPNGETLMDYAVFDAKRAGFSRVVFVIRKDFEAEFREQVAAKYAGQMKVELAFQSLQDLPAGKRVPEGRTKPWGTTHALLAAKALLTGPFAVCNADDFYGREAYAALGQWLTQAKEGEGALVTFRMGATLSEHGTVSRGVCVVEQGQLQDVTECTKLKAMDGGVRDLDAPAMGLLSLETPVSMNFWGFHPSVLGRFEAGFIGFLESLADPLKGEYYLPTAVKLGLKEKWLKVRALPGGLRWFGVTYPEDKQAVQAELKKLVDSGQYPASIS
jgi:NDP-sugar pyrophosphorylase family protein